MVEDNPINRDVLSRLLKRRGYEIAMAENAEEARREIESAVPDIILMDMGLPGVDGWEFTRQLKADQATSSVPIIALTAHAISSDRQRALDAGCDEYEPKPVELDRLLEKMTALIEGG
jgi:CheY-like chemotaxis protein